MRFSAILLLLFSSFAIAESGSDERAALSKPFFDKLENQSFDGLATLVYKDSKYVSKDALKQNDSKFLATFSLLGEYIEKQLLVDLPVGNRWVHQTYLLIFDRQPVLLKIDFYKPRNEWTIQEVVWEADFDDLVAEHAKFKIFMDETMRDIELKKRKVE
ncbi:hypothetical protein [Microbulbifer marinus]|uniref:Uncharacterized protein n=1 Tax=Microbulbifer marinus TaxID=658218 RepID=A0A1H3YL35_9GAMM|nr:hypothetical protein [Microbulbifer marinus]SEA11744.1 hypothetical protein SAMN05216562_1810 [Microbulbifer marinus]